MVYKFKTSKQRSDIMRSIKSGDTEPELALRKELWARGFRYRKIHKVLPGKPDIVLLGDRVAVFVDGEFWHGYNWERKKPKIKVNRSYWIKKIESNIKRDKKIGKELREGGWKVVRFWDSRVKNDLGGCVRKVEAVINEKNQKEKN